MRPAPIAIEGRKVLLASMPSDKVNAAHAMARRWSNRDFPDKGETEVYKDIDFPGRPEKPALVDPRSVKRRRLGSKEGRFALLHAIAHIEFNAIDLAADMLARFALDKRIADSMRETFISDWVNVCDDEARHFSMIQNRLGELGGKYGDLPAHNGLWDAAISTNDDLAARLVVAPMVLEARGLDVTPNMIVKLKNVGDDESAEILSTIYNEEISHVAAGSRWFYHICEAENREKTAYFKSLLDQHFKGSLKPPFNEIARETAGIPRRFYMPELSVR